MPVAVAVSVEVAVADVDPVALDEDVDVADEAADMETDDDGEGERVDVGLVKTTHTTSATKESSMTVSPVQTQAVAPVLGTACESVHEWQEPPPPAVKVPAPQSAQAVLPVVLAVSEPAGHKVQPTAPSSAE